jgi:hypothetical protein
VAINEYGYFCHNECQEETGSNVAPSATLSNTNLKWTILELNSGKAVFFISLKNALCANVASIIDLNQIHIFSSTANIIVS